MSISEYSISFQKKGRNESPNKCINEENDWLNQQKKKSMKKVLFFSPF